MVRKRFRFWSVVYLFLALVVVPPLHAQKLAVSSADPASTEQGTQNLNVTISGRGFEAGSVAEFLVTGTSNPGGVFVQNTTFVDSKTLIAQISVEDAAVISNYDIAVYSGGRTGKGIEKFAVVAKGGGLVCDDGPPWHDTFTELAGSRLYPTTSTLVLNDDGTTYEDFNARRIGNEMDAVQITPGEFLVATQSSTTANTSSPKWLTVLRFDGNLGTWSHIDSWMVPGEPGAVLLTDLDEDGTYDLVHKSGIYFDVAGASPTHVQIQRPTQFSDFFAWDLAVGDVDTGNPGLELVVADRGEDAVFLYGWDPAGTLAYLGNLTGSSHFGRSVAVSASGELYVGDDWATADKRSRESGLVYYFQSGVSCDGVTCSPYPDEPAFFTRGIKNENLGVRLLLANVDGDGWDDLVGSPGYDGLSMAVFHGNGSESALTLPGSHGNIHSLSSADVTGALDREEVFVGASNATNDTPHCAGGGAVFTYVDGSMDPITIRSPVVNGANFGRAVAAVGGFLFVTEMNRDIDGDGTEEGQIYVFVENTSP